MVDSSKAPTCFEGDKSRLGGVFQRVSKNFGPAKVTGTSQRLICPTMDSVSQTGRFAHSAGSYFPAPNDVFDLYRTSANKSINTDSDD